MDNPYNPQEHDPDRRMLRVIEDGCKDFPEMKSEILAMFNRDYKDKFPQLVEHVNTIYSFASEAIIP